MPYPRRVGNKVTRSDGRTAQQPATPGVPVAALSWLANAARWSPAVTADTHPLARRVVSATRRAP